MKKTLFSLTLSCILFMDANAIPILLDEQATIDISSNNEYTVFETSNGNVGYDVTVNSPNTEITYLAVSTDTQAMCTDFSNNPLASCSYLPSRSSLFSDRSGWSAIQYSASEWSSVADDLYQWIYGATPSSIDFTSWLGGDDFINIYFDSALFNQNAESAIGLLGQENYQLLMSTYSGQASTEFNSITVNSSSIGQLGLTNALVASNTNAIDINGNLVQAVPEPTSLALLGLGLAGFGFSRKKKKS